MKKLLIAAIALAAAVTANAAAWDWKTAKSGGAMNGPDTGSALASGTAYLFLSSAAETVFTSWVGGTALSSIAGSLDSASISAGKIAAKSETFDYDADPLNVIFATTTNVGGTDYLYISTVASGAAVDVGKTTLQFKETSASSAALMLASGGYQGAGWYAASVPEPTSGLLMLLGMAGLALRRRRA